MKRSKGIAFLLLFSFFISISGLAADVAFTKMEEKRFLAEVAEKAGRYRDMANYANQVFKCYRLLIRFKASMQ